MQNSQEIGEIGPEVDRVQRSLRGQIEPEHMIDTHEKLLNDLQVLVNSLRAYLKAFTNLRLVCEGCSVIEADLKEGTQEMQTKLFKSGFWEKLGKMIYNEHQKIVDINYVVKEDVQIKELVENFGTECEMTMETAKTLEIAPHISEPMLAAGNALRSIGKMKGWAGDMMVESKKKVDSLIEEIGPVITKIRHYITTIEPKPQHDQSIRFDSMLDKGPTEDKMASQSAGSVRESYITNKQDYT